MYAKKGGHSNYTCGKEIINKDAKVHMYIGEASGM